MYGVELHDVDIDKRHVLPVVANDIPRSVPDRFQIVWKLARGKGDIERKVWLRHGLKVAVDERLKHRLLVGEVVVDVPLRDPSLLGDVLDARRAVAMVREEFQRRTQDLIATPFRFFNLLHALAVYRAGRF